MAGDDDEMFMTMSQRYAKDKTTEQHFIVRIDKYVAYLTNNKRLCSTFCTIEANYILTDTKHRAASPRQQSYLLASVT